MNLDPKQRTFSVANIIGTPGPSPTGQ
jgi:hypothetical protein